MSAPGKRCALYLRVSDPGSGQTVENQRPDLEAMARARGLEVVGVYEDGISAVKRRPGHARMMLDARAGRFEVIVVWALDRFGRSMTGILADVAALERFGVALVSVRDSWLDTSGPARSLLLAIFGWVAEFERSRLIERTRAGMETARRNGVPIGRPRTSRGALSHGAALVEAGQSVAAAAREAGVGERTLRRFLKTRGDA